MAIEGRLRKLRNEQEIRSDADLAEKVLAELDDGSLAPGTLRIRLGDLNKGDESFFSKPLRSALCKVLEVDEVDLFEGTSVPAQSHVVEIDYLSKIEPLHVLHEEVPDLGRFVGPGGGAWIDWRDTEALWPSDRDIERAPGARGVPNIRMPLQRWLYVPEGAGLSLIETRWRARRVDVKRFDGAFRLRAPDGKAYSAVFARRARFENGVEEDEGDKVVVAPFRPDALENAANFEPGQGWSLYEWRYFIDWRDRLFDWLEKRPRGLDRYEIKPGRVWLWRADPRNRIVRDARDLTSVALLFQSRSADEYRELGWRSFLEKWMDVYLSTLSLDEKVMKRLEFQGLTVFERIVRKRFKALERDPFEGWSREELSEFEGVSDLLEADLLVPDIKPKRWAFAPRWITRVLLLEEIARKVTGDEQWGELLFFPAYRELCEEALVRLDHREWKRCVQAIDVDAPSLAERASVEALITVSRWRDVDCNDLTRLVSVQSEQVFFSNVDTMTVTRVASSHPERFWPWLAACWQLSRRGQRPVNFDDGSGGLLFPGWVSAGLTDSDESLGKFLYGSQWPGVGGWSDDRVFEGVVADLLETLWSVAEGGALKAKGSRLDTPLLAIALLSPGIDLPPDSAESLKKLGRNKEVTRWIEEVCDEERRCEVATKIWRRLVDDECAAIGVLKQCGWFYDLVTTSLPQEEVLSGVESWEGVEKRLSTQHEALFAELPPRFRRAVVGWLLERVRGGESDLRWKLDRVVPFMDSRDKELLVRAASEVCSRAVARKLWEVAPMTAWETVRELYPRDEWSGFLFDMPQEWEGEVCAFLLEDEGFKMESWMIELFAERLPDAGAYAEKIWELMQKPVG